MPHDPARNGARPAPPVLSLDTDLASTPLPPPDKAHLRSLPSRPRLYPDLYTTNDSATMGELGVVAEGQQQRRYQPPPPLQFDSQPYYEHPYSQYPHPPSQPSTHQLIPPPPPEPQHEDHELVEFPQDRKSLLRDDTSSLADAESMSKNGDAGQEEGGGGGGGGAVAPPSTIVALFALLPTKKKWGLLLPAIIISLAAGSIAPFMTYVVGMAFDAFAQYPLLDPSEEEKKTLLRDVSISSLALLGLGVGSFILGAAGSGVWVAVGEGCVAEIRRAMYCAVVAKPIAWFDSHSGADSGEAQPGEGGEGGGGLMAKFTRETDTLRHATSLAPGLLIQHLTTVIVCLVLAFVRSWALTLVILSAVPLLMVVQALSQAAATPLLTHERDLLGYAGGIVERLLVAIGTVKAFNAQNYELGRASTAFTTLQALGTRLSGVWALSSGVAQFVMMGMFVQGFWFGGKLVRDGTASPGDVMAVFWACLISTSNLQMCIPHVITLVKGRVAMGGLEQVVGGSLKDFAAPPDFGAPADVPPPPPPPPPSAAVMPTPTYLSPREHAMPPATPLSTASLALTSPLPTSPPRKRITGAQILRGITPQRCHGEIALHNVSFSYPTRLSRWISAQEGEEESNDSDDGSKAKVKPGEGEGYWEDNRALKDVSMYLPAREMTFVVGGSGSGKSSVAGLILRMYALQGTRRASGTASPFTDAGNISLDEQDLRFLDEGWLRSKVLGVIQGTCVIIEGRSVRENIAVALCNTVDPATGLPRVASEEEIEEAARAALLHDFVRDLPNGYDTILSNGGSSGGGGAGVNEGEEDEGADEGDDGDSGWGVKKRAAGGISLSGGQRQRLALARARLRNPEILILDEATSALDPTSRILVFEALKVWRRNKTTIVITHDLSQIEANDFVYVLKNGRVVEGGYRGDLEEVVVPPTPDNDEQMYTAVDTVVPYDLKASPPLVESSGRGEFRKMMEAQQLTGGCLPEKHLDSPVALDARDVDDILEEHDGAGDEGFNHDADRAKNSQKHQSFLRPLTLGNWMFDVVAELLAPSSDVTAQPQHQRTPSRTSHRTSMQQGGVPWTAAYRTNGPAHFPHGRQHDYGRHYRPALPELNRKRRPSSAMLTPVRSEFFSSDSPAPGAPGAVVDEMRGGGGGGGAAPRYRNASMAVGVGAASGLPSLAATMSPPQYNASTRRRSLQFVPTTPSSATFTMNAPRWSGGDRKSGYTDEEGPLDENARGQDSDGEEGEGEGAEISFEEAKEVVKKSGGAAGAARSQMAGRVRGVRRDHTRGRQRRGPGVGRSNTIMTETTIVEAAGDEKKKDGRTSVFKLTRMSHGGAADATGNRGEKGSRKIDVVQEDQEEQPPAFWALIGEAFPSIPNKPLLFFGFCVCAASGALTPVFSFLLSRLLFEVSIGAQNTRVINMFGGIVLSIAAADGLLMGVKYFVMEVVALRWVTAMRADALGGLVKMDMGWFEGADYTPPRPDPRGNEEDTKTTKKTMKSLLGFGGKDKKKSPTSNDGALVPLVSSQNRTPAKLVQSLVKDAEDARNLVAVVMGQCIVVVTMLSVGLLWAMARGWELTLVGLAVAPVFGAIMSLQTTLVGRCEVRNKRAREALAKAYYDTIMNIRGIRSASMEGWFEADFERGVVRALKTGIRGAFVEGCTYGVASGLIYLAEALLFYVGAVLIATERYSYLQMVEVLNLVVFSVTIGSQLMAFTEKIAKSVQATSDLYTLVSLSGPDAPPSQESNGFLKPSPLRSMITLKNVRFAYPSRPDVPILNGLNLTIREGECVALVGPSGCGKSTVAALLQRFYEPTSGSITLGGYTLSDLDITHLRSNISVVSQHPNLFDASVADNIRYGKEGVTQADIEEAARRASVHDFVVGLPNGYDTHLGEGANLVSGGQAQRIQIARALVRPGLALEQGGGDGNVGGGGVLILDECTSALDAENQAAVMDTIRGVVKGAANDYAAPGLYNVYEGAAAAAGTQPRRTTVMVTHKVQIMQMCDRIVVLGDGEVKEQGTYEELVRRKGVFATLANGGEWMGV